MRGLHADHARSERACRPNARRAARSGRGVGHCPGSVATMRKGIIKRLSKETQIHISLTIEGHGKYQVSTGIRFFDHMLELFAHHGGFDLKLKADGDLDVDQHHTVEDAGIVMGQLFSKALGDRKGINRAGYFVLTMDETLAVVALDLGGRPALVYDDKVKVSLAGDLQAEL